MASKRARRWCIALIVVLALYATYRYSLHRMVESKLDEIRKQGYPVTLVELDKWYPQLPPVENAAEIYEQAFTNLHATGKSPLRLLQPNFGDYNTEWPKRTERLSDEVRARVQGYLDENKEALKFFHQAATLDKARYPIDLTNGIDTRLPHLDRLRFGAQLLALEAILSAEKGDLASSLKSIRGCFAMGHSLIDEPILVSQGIRGVILKTGIKTLEHTINIADMGDADLASFDLLLADNSIPYEMPRALIGERCVSIDVFDRIRANRVSKEELDGLLEGNLCGQPSIPLVLFPFYKAGGFLDLDQLEDLKLLKSYVSLSETPLDERYNSEIAVNQLEEDCLRRWWYHFTAVLVPDISFFNRTEARTSAELRVARVALAVERFRIATAKIPDKLEELSAAFVQKSPADPFDGHPLRYKKLAKGYVVYSVGEDGKDDGGDEKKDITFTVER
jgi:tetratricopeptide (TPR) repeat protein